MIEHRENRTVILNIIIISTKASFITPEEREPFGIEQKGTSNNLQSKFPRDRRQEMSPMPDYNNAVKSEAQEPIR